MKRAALLALLAAGACASSPAPATRRARAVDAEVGSLGAVELTCAATGETAPLGVSGDVQVIELWATWCQPCVKALPLWNELARREGIEVLAVSIDDEQEAPLAFAEKLGIDLPVLWDPFARKIASSVPLGGVVPTTLVIDCEGRVRHLREGFSGPDDVEEIAARVRTLRTDATCKRDRALRICAP